MLEQNKRGVAVPKVVAEEIIQGCPSKATFLLKKK